MARILLVLLGTAALTALFPSATFAQDAAAVETSEAVASDALTAEFVLWTLNNLWIMLAGALVFIMHLGFASLESGLTQSKNTVNILFKNTMIICIGILTYALCGFNIMYPGDFNGFLSFAAVPGFISVDPADAAAVAANLSPEYNPGYTWYSDFFFQAMFAATAATIVSGAVAGRIKLSSFLLFVTLLVGLSYPITGAWHWGAGFLNPGEGNLFNGTNFYDFAGSTVVHSVGGWAALVMAILLGPRIGKYMEDGSVRAIPGSNMPLAAIGVFLLWFGWFGFNGGSVLSADAASVSLVLVTTSMAAAAGGLTAGMVSWARDKKPDLSMGLNGILAGLVGITAGADQMMVWEAVVIGAIAGGLVYFAVILFDQVFKIDDPVGAISVHLVCGIWGTLAVGIFGQLAGFSQLVSQLIGIGAIGTFTVAFTFAVALPIKSFLGLRASAEHEHEGLDIGEHGAEAYLIPSNDSSLVAA